MLILVLVIFFCFFFKAEDGIRGRTVTGVQTVCSSDLLWFIREQESESEKREREKKKKNRMCLSLSRPRAFSLSLLSFYSSCVEREEK